MKRAVPGLSGQEKKPGEACSIPAALLRWTSLWKKREGGLLEGWPLAKFTQRKG